MFELRLKFHWSLFLRNNIPALVQIMAWRWPGDKPLYEPMLISLVTHISVTRPQWVSACHFTCIHQGSLTGTGATCLTQYCLFLPNGNINLGPTKVCCMTASSHFLNQYWLITCVLWHPLETNFTTSVHQLNLQCVLRLHFQNLYYISQGLMSFAKAIIWLPQCQWLTLNNLGKSSQE